ncbi:MAG: vWA domain-containing protein [Myxococcota bacterium]
MGRRTTWGMGLAVAFAIAHAAACGSRSELPAPFGAQVRDDDPPGDGGSPPDAPECAVFNSSAQLAAFDLFMMLDTSGSMNQSTASGLPKWDAVRYALSSFFFDPESTGIGIQLDTYPIIQSNLPTYCDSDAACGPTAVLGCQPRRVCADGSRICFADAGCEMGVPCVDLGRCRDQEPPNPNNGDFVICVPGADLPGLTCAQGECLPTGGCDDQFTCDADQYLRLPDDEMLRLPAAKDKLVTELDAIPAPEGGTPTLPALRGVMDAALAWQALNPDVRLGVVVATDGFPSSCDEDLYDNPMTTTDNLAAVAAEGFAAGIRTFVIGVFEPSEENNAEERLDPIANAGGSGRAFVVSTDDDVAADFAEALNQIRIDAGACAFSVTDEETLDVDSVWVKLQRDGADVWVRRVTGPAACDPDDGGFYFDPPPPPTGATSANIVLCPESCDVLGASATRRAEVFTECPDAPSR